MLHPVKRPPSRQTPTYKDFENFSEWPKQKDAGDLKWKEWGLTRRCCQANVMGWSDESENILSYGCYKSSQYSKSTHENVGVCVYKCN